MARGTSFPLLVVQLWKQTCVAVLSLILICLNALCEASDPEVPERESIGLRLLFYAPLSSLGTIVQRCKTGPRCFASMGKRRIDTGNKLNKVLSLLTAFLVYALLTIGSEAVPGGYQPYK